RLLCTKKDSTKKGNAKGAQSHGLRACPIRDQSQDLPRSWDAFLSCLGWSLGPKQEAGGFSTIKGSASSTKPEGLPGTNKGGDLTPHILKIRAAIPGTGSQAQQSYEAKCERRQETRESRRCRPNVTTCRQAGKAPRTQQREQLQRARQQQFFRRRNLKVEEKGKAQSPQAREPGPSRRPGQAADVKEPLSWANRISSPRQQVSGTSSEVFANQHQPPSGAWRDPADHLPSRAGGLPPQDSSIQKPPKHHRGTQTKAEETQPTIKNDASQQTNYGVAVLDKEIIQLSEYLKEALQRELVLKRKMVILQDLLSALIRASDSSWKQEKGLFRY
ncbi:TRAF3-interacting JNK-activating modulator, partial [Eschrichtius robustus]|nr:TRAF3-interacting JNK-activating modulator [Eschrichtius robustus]